MARPKRKDQNPDLNNAIKAAAWKQIEAHGLEALSLRGIARSLNIAAPSIYHYYPTRDALISALVVDAFTSLAEAQRKSIEAVPADDSSSRLSTLGLAYREWAVRNSQRYQLIFGPFVPGIVSPEDVKMPPAAWALLPLIETLQALHEAGKLRVERLPPARTGRKLHPTGWKEFVRSSGMEVDPEVLYIAYIIWARVHGLVSLELGHKTPSFITRPDEVFRREIDTITVQYS